MGKLLLMTEIAVIGKVTRQAIYKSITSGRLKGYKNQGKWYVDVDDYKVYLKNRFSRANSMHEGMKKFDLEKGEFSINYCKDYVSKQLGFKVGYQRIYYLVNNGQIRAYKKGSAWIIMKKDADEYVKNSLEISEYIKKYS